MYQDEIKSFLLDECERSNKRQTDFNVVLFVVADISEIESYRSYSPQDDRQGHHSELSSHSSNERLREKPR